MKIAFRQFCSGYQHWTVIDGKLVAEPFAADDGDTVNLIVTGDTGKVEHTLALNDESLEEGRTVLRGAGWTEKQIQVTFAELGLVDAEDDGGELLIAGLPIR